MVEDNNMPNVGDSPLRQLLEAAWRFQKLQFNRVVHVLGHVVRPGEVWQMAAIARMCRDGEGARPSDLARFFHTTPGNVSQLLASLEKRGFVQRDPDPADRRAVRVTLTHEGTECLHVARGAYTDSLQGLLEHLGPEDAAALTRLLQKANAFFESNGGVPCGN